jgi:hypothetical protein
MTVVGKHALSNWLDIRFGDSNLALGSRGSGCRPAESTQLAMALAAGLWSYLGRCLWNNERTSCEAVEHAMALGEQRLEGTGTGRTCICTPTRPTKVVVRQDDERYNRPTKVNKSSPRGIVSCAMPPRPRAGQPASKLAQILIPEDNSVRHKIGRRFGCQAAFARRQGNGPHHRRK